jgi:hypothetical protein
MEATSSTEESLPLDESRLLFTSVLDELHSYEQLAYGLLLDIMLETFT